VALFHSVDSFPNCYVFKHVEQIRHRTFPQSFRIHQNKSTAIRSTGLTVWASNPYKKRRPWLFGNLLADQIFGIQFVKPSRKDSRRCMLQCISNVLKSVIAHMECKQHGDVPCFGGRGSGSHPEGLPGDFPIPDGTKITGELKSLNESSTGYTVSYDVDKDLDSVSKVYQDYTKDKGYTVTSEMTSDGTYLITGTRNGDSLWLAASESTDGSGLTQVAIIYTVPKQ
jgi:hypothetical protein